MRRPFAIPRRWHRATPIGAALRVSVVSLAVASCSPTAPEQHEAPGGIIFFNQTRTAHTAPAAVIEAVVGVDQAGCLRLTSTLEQATLIWPTGFSWVQIGAEIWIRDERGRETARIGSRLRLAGGFVATLDERLALTSTARRLASSSCPGKYWLVTEVL
jgi:hypothetical protein